MGSRRLRRGRGFRTARFLAPILVVAALGGAAYLSFAVSRGSWGTLKLKILGRNRVPEALLRYPADWISERVEARGAFAARLALLSAQRRFAFQKCDGFRYVAPESGEPRDPMGNSCTPILEGTIVAALDESFLVRSRDDNREAVVSFHIDHPEVFDPRIRPQPRLILRYGGVEATLVPGSVQRLIERIEALPDVREEKRRYEEWRLRQAGDPSQQKK